jgi:hypothetical protein
MKHILFILLFSKLIACNNNQINDFSGNLKPSDSGKIIAQNADDKSVPAVPGCYMKIVGRDTAILKLEQKGKEFIGKMIYDNYEKDWSRGTIK